MRSSLEYQLIDRAKARLDRLALYPTPVQTRRVRILQAPLFFRLPPFGRFAGYAIGPLVLVRRPLAEVGDDLIVHELCHVWQCQHGLVRMWASYLVEGYRHNRHEVEARMAVRLTRDQST